MKKIVIFLLLFILPIKVLAISSSGAIAMDLDNGRIFYSKNASDRRLIASITKIMTAIVAIENTDINKKVVVGDEVLKAYGSAIYIEVGEKLTIKDLLYGLMLRSGNDAAIIIAKNVSGSMEEFVNKMNETAKKIGMEDTTFYNSHGLEENDGTGNLSSAKDMALLTMYAMKNKEFRNIFKTKSYTLTTNYKTYKWKNKNKLLHQEDYITGGKTGFTKKAKRTLVTTGSKDNINVVIVTLNDGNDFLDHKMLYEEIFKKYKSIKIASKGKIKIKNEKLYKDQELYIKNDIYVAVLKEERSLLKVKYELYKTKKFNNNDKIGRIKILLNNNTIKEEDIYIKNNKKKSFRWFKW